MNLTISASVSISASSQASLKRALVKKIEASRRPVNKAMVEQFRQCTYDNLGSSGAFRPHQWADLSPAYARKVKRTYATLNVTGLLRSAIKTDADDNRGRLSIKKADCEYALAHQFGNPARALPDRPYVPIRGSVVMASVRSLVVRAAQLALKVELN